VSMQSILWVVCAAVLTVEVLAVMMLHVVIVVVDSHN
jgi:hypothetical protein